jgi:hypothetical protein
MKNYNTTYIIYAAIVFAVLSLGIVSAGEITVVVGKVYTPDFSSTISDADVEVTCNSNTLTSTSSSDGTFVVSFLPTQCQKGDSVTISATKDGNTYAVDDVTIEVSSDQIPDAGSVKTGGSHSGAKNYYLCGNGKCDSGESIATCPTDCKADTTETTEETINLAENTNEPETEENNSSTETRTPGTFEHFLETIGTAGIIGFLVFLLIVLIGIVVIRKR